MLVPEWQQHSQWVTYTRDRLETIGASFAPLEGEKTPALAPTIYPTFSQETNLQFTSE